MSELRKCKVCEKSKPLDKFYSNKGYKSYTCKACRTAQNNKRRNSSHVEFLKQAHTSLKSSRTKQGFEFVVSVEDLCDIWDTQNGRCALSGVLMTRHRDNTGVKDTNASIDRIDPNEGYYKSNVQLLCWRVNQMKHNMTEASFWFWVRNCNDHLESRAED